MITLSSYYQGMMTVRAVLPPSPFFERGHLISITPKVICTALSSYGWLACPSLHTQKQATHFIYLVGVPIDAHHSVLRIECECVVLCGCLQISWGWPIFSESPPPQTLLLSHNLFRQITDSLLENPEHLLENTDSLQENLSNRVERILEVYWKLYTMVHEFTRSLLRDYRLTSDECLQQSSAQHSYESCRSGLRPTVLLHRDHKTDHMTHFQMMTKCTTFTPHTAEHWKLPDHMTSHMTCHMTHL